MKMIAYITGEPLFNVYMSTMGLAPTKENDKPLDGHTAVTLAFALTERVAVTEVTIVDTLTDTTCFHWKLGALIFPKVQP
jgi:hypothetical protein